MRYDRQKLKAALQHVAKALGTAMKLIITLSALSVIGAAIWFSVDAFEQSSNLPLFTTLAAVRGLAEH
jgi:hypothetical protein